MRSVLKQKRNTVKLQTKVNFNAIMDIELRNEYTNECLVNCQALVSVVNLDRFNLSNDHLTGTNYCPRAIRLNRLVMLQHSLPALKLHPQFVSYICHL